MQARDQKGRFISSAAAAALAAKREAGREANHPPALPIHRQGAHPPPPARPIVSTPAAKTLPQEVRTLVAALVRDARTRVVQQAAALAKLNRSAA